MSWEYVVRDICRDMYRDICREFFICRDIHRDEIS